jgi:hypothetical protein
MDFNVEDEFAAMPTDIPELAYFVGDAFNSRGEISWSGDGPLGPGVVVNTELRKVRY